MRECSLPTAFGLKEVSHQRRRPGVPGYPEGSDRPSLRRNDRLAHLRSPGDHRRLGPQIAGEPLFSELNAADIGLICSYGVERAYPKNAVLITEDEPGERLYVIREGKVKVYVAEANGKEYTFGILGPGDYFGEYALIDGGSRTASVATLVDSALSVVSQSDFERCLAEHPKLALSIMRELVLRLRAVTSDIKNLALRDVSGRVARKLHELSVDRMGIRVVEERLTQQDIASMVGSSREMVSRVMKTLVADGYIEIRDRRMLIRRALPQDW